MFLLKDNVPNTHREFCFKELESLAVSQNLILYPFFPEHQPQWQVEEQEGVPAFRGAER